jgi:hypothetical protein
MTGGIPAPHPQDRCRAPFQNPWHRMQSNADPVPHVSLELSYDLQRHQPSIPLPTQDTFTAVTLPDHVDIVTRNDRSRLDLAAREPKHTDLESGLRGLRRSCLLRSSNSIDVADLPLRTYLPSPQNAARKKGVRIRVTTLIPAKRLYFAEKDFNSDVTISISTHKPYRIGHAPTRPSGSSRDCAADRRPCLSAPPHGRRGVAAERRRRRGLAALSTARASR